MLLLLQAVVLDLEVHLLGPEGLDQLVQVRASLLLLALDDPLAGPRRQAPGQADRALGVPRQ